MRRASIGIHVWAASLVAACATTKGATGGGDATPAGSTPAPTAATAAPADAAGAAFAELAAEISAAQSKGEVDWEDVADELRDITAKHKEHALAWYNLGVASERLGKLEDAENAYRQAIHRDPKLAAAHENLAALVLKQGDARQAVSILQELVDSDPSAASARVALSRHQLARGDADEAVKLAQEALARDPKRLGAYCVLAEAARRAKDPQRVRLIVAQGIKIKDDAEAACLHLSLARVLLSEKMTAEALAEFSRVVEKDPKIGVEARFRIAEISMGYKDFKRAIDNYKAVTEIDPGNVSAYVNLGVAYKGSAQFELAETAYLKAVEVAKDEAAAAPAHFNLGLLYLKNLDKLEEASAQLKRYVEAARPATDDPAFAWLEEIEQRKRMEAEVKRMEAEAAREAEIERKAAEEAAEREEEAKRKAAEAGEPTETPAPAPAPDAPPSEPTAP
jgi:tetratricopeptide (TPR) repeat protein